MDDSLPTNYTVTWTSDGTDSIQSHTLIEQSSYTITALTLDAVYTITVTAANGFCIGPRNMVTVTFSAGIITLLYYIAIYVLIVA